jgi:hypothetical protein
MAKIKHPPAQGLKLEIKVIPPQYFDLPLAEIASLLGNGPLLWPGGAGRSQGVKFTPYELKKKRGRKPKNNGAPARPELVAVRSRTSS